jgi:bla regulator protein blaR1
MMFDPATTIMIASYAADTILMVSLCIAFVLMVRKSVAQYFGVFAAYWLWLLPLFRAVMPPLNFAPAIALERPAVVFVAASDTQQNAPLEMVASAVAQPGVWTEFLAQLQWPTLVLSVWVIGAVGIFSYAVFKHMQLRYRVRKYGAVIGMADGIRIIATSDISGPIAFGIFDKSILIPMNFDSKFTILERELVLQHEVSHHRSGDLILNAAAFILLCALWFNPITWIGYRAFRQDQEAACDARVLAHRDAATRLAYGRALVRSASTGTPKFAPIFGASMHAQNSIVHRVRRLTMKNHNMRRNLAGKMGICAAAIAILPFTATYLPAAADEKAAETVPEKTIRKIIIRDGKRVDPSPSGEADNAGKFIKNIPGKDGRNIMIYSDQPLDDASIQALAKAAQNTTTVESENASGTKSVKTQIRMFKFDQKAGGSAPKQGVDDADMSKLIANISSAKQGNMNCDAPMDENASADTQMPNVKIRLCNKSETKIGTPEKVAAIRAAIREIESESTLDKKVRDQAVLQMENAIKQIEGSASK